MHDAVICLKEPGGNIWSCQGSCSPNVSGYYVITGIPNIMMYTIMCEDFLKIKYDTAIGPMAGVYQQLIEIDKYFVGKGELGDWFTTVIMHRQLYQSTQGELDVRIGEEGLVEKAVLKDLIFFGDVRIIKQ